MIESTNLEAADLAWLNSIVRGRGCVSGRSRAVIGTAE